MYADLRCHWLLVLALDQDIVAGDRSVRHSTLLVRHSAIAELVSLLDHFVRVATNHPEPILVDRLVRRL